MKSLREADEYEHKLAKVYSANLDANLIFVGIFSPLFCFGFEVNPTSLDEQAGLLSAVSSAFIVGVQAQFLLQTGPDANPDSPWIDDYSFFLVQPYLFSSLIVSLLAAFAAVSGKQWVDRVHMRRSPIDRSRDGRLNGAKRPIWGLSFLIHSPPIMLQLALLLLGLALCTYLFTIDQTSAYILVIFFAVGLGPYCYMAYQAFNSAVSRPQIHWHLLITTVYLNEFLKESWWLLRRLFSQTRPNDGQGKADGDLESALQSNPMGPVPSPPSHSPVSSGEDTNHGENSADQSNKIYMVSVSDAPTNPPVSSGEDTDQERNSGGESTPPHPNIHAVPLKRLYKTLTENFCTLFGRTVVIPKLEEKAYFSAKALLYAAVQCKYKGNESDKAAFDYISSQYKDKGTWHFKTNSPDLLSTLGIMDHVFKPDGFEEIPWDALSLTYPHQAWMGQILLYRASCILNDGKPLPDDIRGFVLYSLRSDPPPPPPIVLDCLRIICLVLKMEPDPDDQQGMDKRSAEFMSPFCG